MAALCAEGTAESEAEDAAFEKAAEFLLDVARHGPHGGVPPGEPALEVLGLGQAPLVNFAPQRCQHNYRWRHEYSGGKFADWGGHHVDIAQWALSEDTADKGAVTIDGTDAKHPVPFVDGMPTRDDSFNTAHDFAVVCGFPGGAEMVITSRGDNGILFEGDKGRMFVNREKIVGKPIEEAWDKDAFGESDLVALYKGKPYEGHKKNFYRCIREGGCRYRTCSAISSR